jgi:hypothetical protein
MSCSPGASVPCTLCQAEPSSKAKGLTPWLAAWPRSSGIGLVLGLPMRILKLGSLSKGEAAGVSIEQIKRRVGRASERAQILRAQLL